MNKLSNTRPDQLVLAIERLIHKHSSRCTSWAPYCTVANSPGLQLSLDEKRHDGVISARMCAEHITLFSRNSQYQCILDADVLIALSGYMGVILLEISMTTQRSLIFREIIPSKATCKRL